MERSIFISKARKYAVNILKTCSKSPEVCKNMQLKLNPICKTMELKFCILSECMIYRIQIQVYSY